MKQLTAYLFLVLTLAMAVVLGCDADILGFGDRPGGGYDVPKTPINYIIKPPDNAPLDVGCMAALSFVDKSYANDQGMGTLYIVDGDDYQIIICLSDSDNVIMLAYAEPSAPVVEFSASSTADALIMMHPLLIEIPYSEKTILLDSARLHNNYNQLVTNIEALIVFDPYNALNPNIHTEIFEAAVGIFEDVFVDSYYNLSSKQLGASSSLSSSSTPSSISPLPNPPGGTGDVELTQDDPGSGIIEFKNWKAIHYMATTEGNEDGGDYLHEYTWVGSKGVWDIVQGLPKITEYRLPDGHYTVTAERGNFLECQQWSEAAYNAGTANIAKGILHAITVVAGLPGFIPEQYKYAVALADLLKDMWLVIDDLGEATPAEVFLEILKYAGKHFDDITYFFREELDLIIHQYFGSIFEMLGAIFKIAGYGDALAYAYDICTATDVTYEVEMIDGVLYFPDDGDAPPDTPQLIYPENGQTDVEPRPTFRWTETMSSGWAPFEQVSQSASATNATGANRLTGTAAVACQASNAQAQLNHIRQSAEGYNPLSPAESYRIQVDDNSDFSSPEIDRSGITDNQFKPSSDLGENKTYYWRVRAHNQWGDSSWSTVWHFTTGGETGTPPDAPSLIYPENGQTDVELRPTFQWTATMSSGWAPFEQVSSSTSATNATGANRLTEAATAAYQASTTQAQLHRIRQSAEGYNPLSPAESYRIQADDNSDFSSPEIDSSGITDNQYRPSSDLDAQTRYYWRVRAHNQWGDSDWSAVWSFTTRPPSDEPPEIPQLIYPDDGDTDVPVRPTFLWTATRTIGGTLYGHSSTFGRISPAEDYHIQVDNEPSFSTPRIIDAEYIPTNEYTHDSDLDYGTDYYWRVRARNDAGYSDWSGAYSFTTEESPEWHIETVDSAGIVGEYTSLALDSSGYPHISYYDQTNADLKYASWNGSTWQIETVDSAGIEGWWTSLALDSSDRPHISYYDNTNEDLKYASWNGSSWQIETVDSAGRVGWWTSLALDSSGRPHISYFDETNSDLKYASWNGSSWQKETVDSAGYVGVYTSLTLDSSGYPHISYFDGTNSDLKYARWNGSSWQIQTVDSAGDVGYYTSLALDSSGYPRISYYDQTNSDLKYARWNGSSWQIETVDSSGNVGEYTSLALDSSGRPHISYRGYGYLRYARWTGSSWQKETVDSTGNLGWWTSLTLDSSDNPHISYYDDSNFDLKYAYWE